VHLHRPGRRGRPAAQEGPQDPPTPIRWRANANDRLAPLTELAHWVDKRRNDKHATDRDLIATATFNIPNLDDPLFKAITSKALKMPAALRGAHGSKLAKNKRSDQILHSPTNLARFTNNAGLIDFYAGSHKGLFPGVEMTKKEFTYQVSDHLPVWVQVDCDVDGEKLDQWLG
jgi:hypothetical protein